MGLWGELYIAIASAAYNLKLSGLFIIGFSYIYHIYCDDTYDELVSKSPALIVVACLKLVTLNVDTEGT